MLTLQEIQDAMHEELVTEPSGLTGSELCVRIGCSRYRLQQAMHLYRRRMRMHRINLMCDPHIRYTYRLISIRADAEPWVDWQKKYTATRTRTTADVVQSTRNAVTGRSARAVSARAVLDAELVILQNVVLALNGI